MEWLKYRQVRVKIRIVELEGRVRKKKIFKISKYNVEMEKNRRIIKGINKEVAWLSLCLV